MSLVETSCAAAILALAIGGLTNLAATSASLHAFGLEKNVAVRAVERQLATVMASDFATITADWNGDGFAVGMEGAAGSALNAVPGDADGLPGSIAITAPTGDADELVEIEVRVDWNSSNGPAAVARRMRLSRLGSGS